MMNEEEWGRAEWHAYWQEKGFPWRTEPEIDAKRQEELSKCRAIVPDIEKGIYPFKGIHLERADVEWLLVTHEDGDGPVDWSDKSQREREGLDLHGADLRNVDLKELPLARLNRSSNFDYTLLTAKELKQQEIAVLHLEGAILIRTHLEDADLLYAHLEEAILRDAYLEKARILGAHLEGADLHYAHLEEATLSFAHLEKAMLMDAQLEEADLNAAHLEGANLFGTHLKGAILSRAFFDNATYLDQIDLGDDKYGPASLVNIRWDDVNVTDVNWASISRLGDERTARKREEADGTPKDTQKHVDGYQTAVRAYRQLAMELQDQGLNEDAARFAYRAKVLERQVFWYQVRGGQVRQLGAYLFSWFLALLTGYGYRMWHIIVAYLIIILTFSIAYWGVGVQHPGDISFWQTLIVSVTAFHGRVFTNPFTPNVPDAQIAITAIEAVVGLIIEGVFIAMLVQRFFGK
jgi:uncharacterized protein YjbI with pentapeptide repeats